MSKPSQHKNVKGAVNLLLEGGADLSPWRINKGANQGDIQNVPWKL